VNDQQRHRGRHLVAADRRFATGGGPIVRLTAGGIRTILDRIDANLPYGSILVALPDGSRRMLGGRGEGPAAEVEIKSWRAFLRLAASGSAGWYKAWTLGEWASPDPVALFESFSLNVDQLGEIGRAKGLSRVLNRIAHALRSNTRSRARLNIAHHYDVGNDFYAAWLDASMTYSSALFEEPITEQQTLEDAQARKIRTLLDRLGLRPGQRLLEIGCGWGSLMEIAAREYGVHVTGLTLSCEQKAFADARLREAGLAERTDIQIRDYRDVVETFDAVASVEMVEAVGQEYWPAYLQTIARALKPGGKAALQLIAMRDSLFDGYASNTDFIQTYIFPGGMLIGEPPFKAIAEAAGLEWRDRRGFRLHYAETLRRWRMCYNEAVAQNRLPAGFDDSFHNLWRFYLMYCEGGFRGGSVDVAQVTLVKH
jgi:cyclopropane-fatty-acyl-phospholipid synthase